MSLFFWKSPIIIKFRTTYILIILTFTTPEVFTCHVIQCVYWYSPDRDDLNISNDILQIQYILI